MKTSDNKAMAAGLLGIFLLASGLVLFAAFWGL